MKSRRAGTALLALLFFFGFALASGHFAFHVRRVLTLPAVNPTPVRERLLRCSNIAQTVDAPGVTNRPADVAGWDMFTVTDDAPAVLTVVLRKQTDRVVFYPRLAGPQARVTVEEPLGRFARLLFSLSGQGGTWTPVGAQYPLCLGCVENGWSQEAFPVTLRITLTGRGTQLWHQGETVFFEAP